MNQIPEIGILERNLSLVMGKQVNLGSPEASRLNPGELKRAYYRRAHECHPDKARSLGLPPEYLATRFRSLQDAYDSIREAFESGEFANLVSRSNKPFSDTVITPLRPQQKPQTAHTAPPVWPEPPKTRAPSGFFYTGPIPGQRLRFAQYLYYARRIDWNTLIGSMSWQFSMRSKLGTLGIELGYLSHEDVCAILRARRPDEFFGEAAVRLGFLSTAEHTILVGRQRLINIPIGRFFVERGYISESELGIYLNAFHNHNFRIRIGKKP